MTARQTAAVAAVLAVVASAYWLGEPARRAGEGSLPEVEQATRVPLLELKADQVSAIDLEFQGEQRTTTRSSGSWSHTESPDLIDSLLKDLATLGVVSELDVSPEELPDFGLRPPRGRLRLHRSGEVPIELEVGDRNPPNTGVYVRFPATGKVQLAGALLEWQCRNAWRVLEATGPRPEGR